MCPLSGNYQGITKGFCSRDNFLPELKEPSNNSVTYIPFMSLKNSIFYMAVLCNSSSLRMSGYGLSFILCMCLVSLLWTHYNDVIMGTMASQITSLAVVYSTVYSGGDQRKHQSSASLDFVRGIHRWQMASNAENVSIWYRHNVIIFWQGALPSVDYIRSWHNLDVFLIKRYRGVCFFI